jgi:uncharacterized membrane-anchored protein
MLIPSINNALSELSKLLKELSKDDYVSPCYGLSNATIGEHTRHIIEMFQCLNSQYKSGIVNYDLRKRDYLIQTDTDFAEKSIQEIIANLDKQNINLQLQQIVDGEELLVESNYNRELLYNLEHCIHHQALIKVALLLSESVKVSVNFGVARSTIEYRNQCAQ